MTQPKMTETELKKIAGKIAKCLALAASDNPNEADSARRQAQSLMEKYNLTTGDVAAAQVHERHSRTGGKYNPPQYINRLAAIIAKAFGCSSITHDGSGWNDSHIKFLGLGIKPELAAYTFDVLRRQITKDRATYGTTLKRYKRANKIRMADLFCEAWNWKISKQVYDFAGTDQDKSAIAAYAEKKWGDSLKNDERTSHAANQPNDYQAIQAGAKAAKDVSILKPVQSKHGALLN
jgi:hypothetical protein